MKIKNTGIPYEILTMQVFDQILKQSVVQNIEVQHNVDLQGIITSHQIDVYWEFSLNGIQYRTIIQAKDWGSKVKKEHMLAFLAVLEDLPSGTLGIFVSKSGYQTGAIEVARAHGIQLYELRSPTEEDLTGTIKKIQIDMDYQIPYYKNLTVAVDQEWCNENSVSLPVDSSKNQLHGSGVIVSESDEHIDSIADWIQECYKTATVEEKIYTKHYEDAFIILNNGAKLKLSYLRANIGRYEGNNTLIFDVEKIVATILKDISNGKILRFDKHNTLLDGQNG